MRILVIADPHIPVPPEHYGGAERTIAYLCEGLVQRGHTVDLLAAPGSKRYNGELTFHRPPTASKVSRAYRKLLFQIVSKRAAKRAEAIIAFNRLDYLWALARTNKPMLLAFQNPVDQSQIDSITTVRRTSVRFVGVSHDQMSGLEPRELIDVVHNITDPSILRFSAVPETAEPYFAFLGRLTANKGVHLAMQAAREAGVRLRIAGNISEGEAGGKEFFETQVKPHLGRDGIEWIGPVDDAGKAKLLGGAMGLLFPIQWKEPCALVLPEALACGCPVIGWRNGSVAEVIRHGKTGFVVDSVDMMVEGIRNIASIDRAECRRDAEERFSPKALIDGYISTMDRIDQC